MKSIALTVLVVLSGCAVESPAVSEVEEAVTSSSLCPGTAPPPIECWRVVCLGGDATWEYQPLSAGTSCGGGTGECDGQGTCVVFPPVQQRLAIPSSLVAAGVASYLGGTVFSIDTTGNAPPLITGSHTECTEGPGGIGLICIEIPHAHYSYIKFSNAVKAATGATDYPLNLSRFCNVLTCADVNQVRGDLVNTRIEVSQAAGGAVVKAILSVESGHPTLNISLFSDVELTNVELFVEGTILPSGNRVTVTSTAISGGIDFHLAASPPEWLIDIDALIRDAVRARVRDAFLDQARRRAIDDALNSAIGTYASAFVPGFTGFRQVNFVSASGGTLYIDYVPN